MAVELAAEKLITYAVIITEATTAHVRRRSWRQQTVVVFINSLPSLCYYALGSADDDFWDQDHDDVTIELRIESKKSRYSKYIKLLLDDWANQNIPVSVQICVHNDGDDDDSDDTYLASWLCVEVNTTSWFLAAGLRTCQLLRFVSVSKGSENLHSLAEFCLTSLNSNQTAESTSPRSQPSYRSTLQN